MTPAQLGYARCARCGCLRPMKALLADVLVQPQGMTMRGLYCADAAVCGRLAGVGQGTLDADEGGPGP